MDLHTSSRAFQSKAGRFLPAHCTPLPSRLWFNLIKLLGRPSAWGSAPTDIDPVTGDEVAHIIGAITSLLWVLIAACVV
jgi:hypothetical protein